MTDEEQKPESGKVLKIRVYTQTYTAIFYINLWELFYILHILLDMKSVRKKNCTCWCEFWSYVPDFYIYVYHRIME